jgi:hypothetical protein
MKATRTVLTLIILLAGLMLWAAENPNMGTWKLNEAKSKIGSGMAKNLVVKYEAADDKIKTTIDGVDGKGNPTHNEWIGKFDGKDYPVTGDPTSDSRSIKQTDVRNLEVTVKKDGKVRMTGKIVVAADGKSRTVTITSTDAAGKKVEATFVYDKQ